MTSRETPPKTLWNQSARQRASTGWRAATGPPREVWFPEIIPRHLQSCGPVALGPLPGNLSGRISATASPLKGHDDGCKRRDGRRKTPIDEWSGALRLHEYVATAAFLRTYRSQVALSRRRPSPSNPRTWRGCGEVRCRRSVRRTRDRTPHHQRTTSSEPPPAAAARLG
jgi:hypothetical protein